MQQYGQEAADTSPTLGRERPQRPSLPSSDGSGTAGAGHAEAEEAHVPRPPGRKKHTDKHWLRHTAAPTTAKKKKRTYMTGREGGTLEATRLQPRCSTVPCGTRGRAGHALQQRGGWELGGQRAVGRRPQRPTHMTNGGMPVDTNQVRGSNAYMQWHAHHHCAAALRHHEHKAAQPWAGTALLMNPLLHSSPHHALPMPASAAGLPA